MSLLEQGQDFNHSHKQKTMSILNEISFGSKLKIGVYYIKSHFILLHQLTHKG